MSKIWKQKSPIRMALRSRSMTYHKYELYEKHECLKDTFKLRSRVSLQFEHI